MGNIEIFKIIIMNLMAVTSVYARDYYLQPFSDNSPWNKPLIEYQEYVDNDIIKVRKINNLSAVVINSKKWSIPFYKASKYDPVLNVYVKNISKNVSLRMPKEAQPAKGKDAHLNILSENKKTIYEFYKYNKAKRIAKSLKIVDIEGLGVSQKPGYILGTRAYGGSSVGGLIRNWELAQNEKINHPLALAIGGKYLKSGYVWPASSEDSHSNKSYTGTIAMGSVITLPKELDISGILSNDTAKNIAHALQEYGGYIVDTVGNNNIILYAEPTANHSMLKRAAKQLSQILPHLIVLDGYNTSIKQ
ncbi:MAG: hypothetical protein KZQ96_06085 [Candidatus Thiodiazotropha sp. (ex Lucinoma borealis)]|nr:hypothetical protein [Candidatus Thiodiazotropha sp. (ex Lucinoma borealis)]